MAELTTSQLIKIIIGVFVFVVVVLGIFLFFKDTVIDFFKNLPGDEEVEKVGGVSQSGKENGDETKLGLKEKCEVSDCMSKPPEDLVCNALGNVKGYLYKCTRKGCVRTQFKKEVQKCDYGCKNAVCSDCVPSGTAVKTVGNPHRSNCCDGYYCLERFKVFGVDTVCLEQKCN